MSTTLTQSMEAWMASKIDTHDKAVQKRFERWNNQWLFRFSEIAADASYSLCPCGHEEWVKSVCRECGQMARPSDHSIEAIRPFAKTLGHLWTTLPEGLIEPVNATELAYVTDGLKLWGSWGYNPPLTYTANFSTHEPWKVQKIIHTTSKQRFEVDTHGWVYYTLTTTTNIPVATATVFDGKFRITGLNPENTTNRPDRWDWLETWVSTFSDSSIDQWMAVETLTKCQWGESHPTLSALAKDFLSE